jgi:hypothetical protein
MRRHVSVVILAALVFAAPAAAAGTAAKPKFALDLQKVGHVKRNVAFAGKTFRVRGTVRPFVPGQSVRVRLYLGKKLLSVKNKRIRQLGKTSDGVFRASFRTKLRGRYRMGVTHVRTAEMGYAHGKTSPINVVNPSTGPGDTGHSVRVLQRLLRDIGYVPGHPGVYDDRTARAVLAFRKVSGLTRITTASRIVYRRLINGGGVFQVRYPNHGHHAEADLGKQVLALIDHGKVERIYPISSGAPWTPTILGSFRVYLKAPGTNAKGMVHSSYFIRGYAIHGYSSVPTYPASHGCLRVPIPDAWSIFEWINFGDYVDTYYRSGKHRSGKAGAKVGP